MPVPELQGPPYLPRALISERPWQIARPLQHTWKKQSSHGSVGRPYFWRSCVRKPGAVQQVQHMGQQQMKKNGPPQPPPVMDALYCLYQKRTYMYVCVRL